MSTSTLLVCAIIIVVNILHFSQNQHLSDCPSRKEFTSVQEFLLRPVPAEMLLYKAFFGVPTREICLKSSIDYANENSLIVVFKNGNCRVYFLKFSSFDGHAASGQLFRISDVKLHAIWIDDNYDSVMEEALSTITTAAPVYVYPSSCLADVALPAATQKLLQQRVDGCLLFNKTWTEYVNGFGHSTGNYWIGLQELHDLTKNGAKKWRFEMKKFGDATIYVAEYSWFSVTSVANRFKLTTGGFDGAASNANNALLPGNVWSSHNQMFSTFDEDNDANVGSSCSTVYGNGGWWFQQCSDLNPNGIYSSTSMSSTDDFNYIFWWQLNSNANNLEKFKIIAYN